MTTHALLHKYMKYGSNWADHLYLMFIFQVAMLR